MSWAVERVSIARVRADRLLLRRAVLAALAALVLLAVARTLVWPPTTTVVERVTDSSIDASGDALAQTFAATWLTVDTEHPEIREEALKVFGDGEWQLENASPQTVKRSVLATQVAQVAPREDGSRVVVVQAQLSTQRTVYLAVREQRTPDGDLQIVGAPAIVGEPSLAAAVDLPNKTGDAVDDRVAVEVVTRGLRNLLARRTNDLRADLQPNARVGIPASPLQLGRVERMTWTDPGISVLARVSATDADGLQLSLDYELDINKTAEGRWLIAAVHIPA